MIKHIKKFTCIMLVLFNQSHASSHDYRKSQQFKLVDTEGIAIAERNYLIVYVNGDLNSADSFLASGHTDNKGYTDTVKTQKKIGIIVSDPDMHKHKKYRQKCIAESKKQKSDLHPTFRWNVTSDYMIDKNYMMIVTEVFSCEYEGV